MGEASTNCKKKTMPPANPTRPPDAVEKHLRALATPKTRCTPQPNASRAAAVRSNDPSRTPQKKSLSGAAEAAQMCRHIKEENLSGDGMTTFSLLRTSAEVSTPPCDVPPGESFTSPRAPQTPSDTTEGIADAQLGGTVHQDAGPQLRDDGVWVVTDRPKVVRRDSSSVCSHAPSLRVPPP